MPIIQKVLFGGIDLLGTHDYVFNPSFGPVDFQTMRRHPFGLKGELELRGRLGGQTILVPIRMFRTKYDELRKAVDDLSFFKVGKHDKLAVQFSSLGSQTPYGEVTFDAVQELTPIRAVVYDTNARKAGFDVALMLAFRKLNVED